MIFNDCLNPQSGHCCSIEPSFDSIVSKKFFLQKVKYTNLNAQKHKIVNDMEKYFYSSYHNHYCDHKTLLEIDDIKGIL